jgi:hypothetical protein
MSNKRKARIKREQVSWVPGSDIAVTRGGTPVRVSGRDEDGTLRGTAIMPNLQGNYQGTCVSCLTPTDTGLALEGEPEFVIAGLTVFGIDQPIAAAIVEEHCGTAPGKVPDFDICMSIQVCQQCAARAHLTPRLLAGGKIAVYRQPDDSRPR